MQYALSICCIIMYIINIQFILYNLVLLIEIYDLGSFQIDNIYGSSVGVIIK